MLKHNELNQTTVYQISIQGHLKESWAIWLSDMIIKIYHDPEYSNQTTITAAVSDQAALRGVLNKLWDLNLTLISVRRHKGEIIGGPNEN